MPSKEETEAQLLSEYCPPLDPAVCLAILLDYDVDIPEQLSEARETLAMLTESAAAEEASGFDPSGSGGYAITNNGEAEDDSSPSRRGLSSNTDATSLSHGFSSLDLDGESAHWSETNEDDDVQRRSKLELDSLSGDLQEAILINSFSTLKPIDIKMALKRHNGDASKAVEDLLLRVYLVENEIDHRGIDGFSEGHVLPPTRKGKKKKKGKKWETYTGGELTDAPAPSIWNKGQQDIEFISQRLKLPQKQVSSLYHQKGASLKATVFHILDTHPERIDDADLDPILELHAHELNQEFTTLSRSHILTLVHLTHPSTVAAHEVAEALVAQNPAGSKLLQVDLHYAPLLPEQGSSAPAVKPYAYNAVHTTPQSGSSLAVRNASDTDVEALVARRGDLWRQIQSNLRRARANNLMGGAVAHYSNEAAQTSRQVREAQRRAADDLVQSQSTRDSIDLHGVTVHDAVRLAEAKVNEWWAHAGSRNYDDGSSHSGFRIITGLGRHSEGGRSKIGPPVRKMLQRQGWRFKEGEGWFLVIGTETSARR